MNRRSFLKTIGGGSLAARAASRTAGQDGRPAPNLVFVFPDQMRMHAMGFWNTPGFELNGVSDPVVTPALDRFAHQGLVLRQAVSSHPVCSPYRASLMTGQYSFRNRVHWNCNSNTEPAGNELPADARCWSDILKEKGYSLGYIGKWHLDAPREPYVDCYNNRGKTAWNEWCSPDRRHGFDFWHAYGTFDHHMDPLYWPTDAPRDGFIRPGTWGPEYEADLAIRYIRNEGGDCRRPGRPFALVVSMNPPHTPYSQVPDRYRQAYEGKTWEELLNRPNIDTASEKRVVKAAKGQIRDYFAMVTGVDEQFGRIVQAVDDAGLRDNTLIVFTSDHGNCVGCHGVSTKNVPYEESFRIPFLASWPGRIPARVDDLHFGAADIMPTLLGLLGQADTIPDDVDGQDFSGIFLGQDGRRPAASLYIKPSRPDPTYGERGVRTDRYTLVIRKSGGAPPAVRLYNNREDPYQLTNLADAKPELVRTLAERELHPILEAYGDPWLTA